MPYEALYATRGWGGHSGLRKAFLLSRNLDLADEVADWPAEEPTEIWLTSLVFQRTRSGQPAGDGTFMGKLESLLGRTVCPGKPGRPRKRP